MITGTSTGIGRGCALRLDRAGFDVFAGVRHADDGQRLRAEASNRLRPLILDKRVATALRERGIFGPRAGNADWPSDLYRRYLTYCHEQNPADPVALEADLFNEGRAEH